MSIDVFADGLPRGARPPRSELTWLGSVTSEPQAVTNLDQPLARGGDGPAAPGTRQATD